MIFSVLLLFEVLIAGQNAGPTSKPTFRVQLIPSAGEELRNFDRPVSVVSLTDSEIVFEGDSKTTAIASAKILRLETSAKDSPRKPSGSDKLVRVLTTEGGRLLCRSIVTKDKTATLGLWGSETNANTLEFPVANLLALRLAPLSAEESADWVSRSVRPKKQDLLTVAKDNKKLELQGVAGDFNGETLSFLFDGDMISVPKIRILELGYANPYQPGNSGIEILDRAGQLLIASQLEASQTELTMTLAPGLTLKRPWTEIIRIDFSRGRVMHLSDLEPTIVQHVPFFDTPWPMKRDTNLSGQAIRLGGKVYSKGIALHSKTTVVYSIGNRFKKFESMIGIEDTAGPLGDALVRIRGDGKTLFEARIRAGNTPQRASLQVEQIQELELQVDFGDSVDLGDQVVFADALLSK